MATFVLATRNQGKLREMRAMLEPVGLEVLSLDDFENVPEVEETGNTFQENAALKAEAISAFCKMSAIADDSGLVVDALDGAPGVYSARFAGEDATDAENVSLLLEKLLSNENRAAHFECVIAIAGLEGETKFYSGRTDGEIAREVHGENGFGYDPVFISNDLGITFAEAAQDKKNAVSHRGRALKKMLGNFKTNC